MFWKPLSNKDIVVLEITAPASRAEPPRIAPPIDEVIYAPNLAPAIAPPKPPTKAPAVSLIVKESPESKLAPNLPTFLP